MSRSEFIYFVKHLQEPANFSYTYEQGNDEYRSKGWQRRTADFQFGIVNSRKVYYLLESRRTNRNSDVHQNELVKKYSYWARQAIKNIPGI